MIEATVEDFAQRNGWQPVFHTVGEVSEFREYVDSITDSNLSAAGKRKWIFWKDGKAPSAERLKWIQRWVENERFACFASAEYFATRYGRIRDAEERIISFQLRLSQQILLNVLADCDDLQSAIQLFVLKARQVGISTMVAMFFIHRILFRQNTYAVMASVQAQQSDKLGTMIDTTWDSLPFWLPPPKTILKAKEPKWANGSLLSIQSGSQEVGIAQGSTPTCVHISEIGDYANPKKVLEEGLFPACHPTRSLFMVLEGTGSMATLWQKEKWEYYTANWGKGGRFQPFFIPPACARDLYPHADWLRNNPIPSLWEPAEETRRMRRRAELFVRSTDYLWKVLGQRWEMDKEFMWYWECLWRESVASHSEHEHLAQFAPTPEDAFQSKDTPVFSKETIEIVSQHRVKNCVAYAITGRTIFVSNENVPYRPHPEMIDPFNSRIDLRWEANDGNLYDWELYPLKPFDDSKDENCYDKLLIFEPPEPGAIYAIGLDTAYGLNTPNEDRCSLTVHKHDPETDPDVQVASFTSLQVNSAQMARIAAAVAVLYGTDGKGNIISGNPLIAKFVIEQIRKPGDTCQHELKLMGFLDHHIMHHYDDRGNIDPTKGSKEGWRTSRWSRSILLERFVEAVTLGRLILNDPIVIRQLPEFVRKYQERGISEMIHGLGCHDDGIFSAAMCWTTLHDFENVAERLEKRNAPVRVVKNLDDAWCERFIVLE